MRRLVSDYRLNPKHFCFLCLFLQTLAHGMKMSFPLQKTQDAKRVPQKLLVVAQRKNIQVL